MPKVNKKLPYEEPAKFDEEMFCSSIEACSCLYDKGDKNYHRLDVVDATWHRVKKIHHFKLSEISLKSLKFYLNSSFFDCVTYAGTHHHHYQGQWTQNMTVFSVTHVKAKWHVLRNRMGRLIKKQSKVKSGSSGTECLMPEEYEFLRRMEFMWKYLSSKDMWVHTTHLCWNMLPTTCTLSWS